MAHIAVAEVVASLFQLHDTSGVVGINHAYSSTLTYPDVAIAVFEEGIHIAVFQIRYVSRIDNHGFGILFLDDDAEAVVGKPDFSVMSLDDVRDAGR